jgi:cytochrome b561
MVKVSFSEPWRYGAMAQSFHWLTALLVVAAYALSPGGSEQRVYAAATDFSRQAHETLGLCVFAIVLLRLLWRAIDAAPERIPMPLWVKRSSTLVHGMLYALLVGLPVTAVTGAWLGGHPVTLLGGASIGPLGAPNHDTGRLIASIHGWLGTAILWIAGLHAAAGLCHHFILKDRVLWSMLPARWTSNSSQ